VDGVTYRYVNIAVDPDSPSRDSKDAGTIPILKSVPGTSPRSAMKTFVRSLVSVVKSTICLWHRHFQRFSLIVFSCLDMWNMTHIVDDT
jgi:hypothetical protein